LLSIINRVPGLNLRDSHENELLGTDYIEMGEVAYEMFPFDDLKTILSKVESVDSLKKNSNPVDTAVISSL
jgi:hypothetical protein